MKHLFECPTCGYAPLSWREPPCRCEGSPSRAMRERKLEDLVERTFGKVGVKVDPEKAKDLSDSLSDHFSKRMK